MKSRRPVEQYQQDERGNVQCERCQPRREWQAFDYKYPESTFRIAQESLNPRLVGARNGREDFAFLLDPGFGVQQKELLAIVERDSVDGGNIGCGG